MQYLSGLSLLVNDYDTTIAWFSAKLGFVLVEDTHMGGGKRWVTMTPDTSAQTQLIFALATTPDQVALIGCQFGGRVGFFLTVDDFDATYQRMLAKNVRFRETPRNEPFGKVVVFEDCCGNGWDLLERTS